MVFCPKCGKEVDNDNDYCIYCGTLIKPLIEDLNSNEKSKIEIEKQPNEETKVTPKEEKNEPKIIYKETKKEKSSKKKYILMGIAIIIIILIIIGGVSLFLSKGDFSELPYTFSSHKININSVEYIGDYGNSGGDYNGTIKEYKVTFTPVEDLHNITIETYAYTENGTALDPMANWFGLNSLNLLMYKDNATAGSTQTATIVFGDSSGSDFEISYLKVFVYGFNKQDEEELVSKFTYNL